MSRTGLEWCRDRGWAATTFEAIVDACGDDLVDHAVLRFGWRDAVLLGWAARFPVFTQTALGERWGVQRSNVSRSVKRWRQLGLCQQHTDSALRWPLEQVTPAASDLLGMIVPARRPSSALSAHSIGVLDVTAAAELAGWSTMTERDFVDDSAVQRALDDPPSTARLTSAGRSTMDAMFDEVEQLTNGGDVSFSDTTAATARPWWPVTVQRPDGVPADHPPDAIFRRGDETVAVEVELTHKTTGRVERILDGYGRARVYTTVAYLVPKPTDARRLDRANNTGQTKRCDTLVASTAFDWTHTPLAVAGDNLGGAEGVSPTAGAEARNEHPVMTVGDAPPVASDSPWTTAPAGRSDHPGGSARDETTRV